MPGFTNMAWPEDPYGTGQLWRKEPHLLAGFSVCHAGEPGKAMPVSYAVVYVRLHRTQPADLTPGVSFGFRAVTVATDDQMEELVRVLDLDILRARRLAKIITGHSLARDLHAIAELASPGAGRGIRGLQAVLRASDPASPGMARVANIPSGQGSFAADIAVLPASGHIASPTVSWAYAAQHTIDSMAATAQSPQSPGRAAGAAARWLAACATERALVCAVTAGRMLDRLTWDELLDIAEAMAANAWDSFGPPHAAGENMQAVTTPTGSQP